MTFGSVTFLFFFAAVLVVDRLLPSLRWRNLALLAASYLFYAAWDWRLCALLALTSLLDYLIGNALGAQKRRWALWLGIGFNLGALLLLKYFDFFTGSLASLLTSVGLPTGALTLNLVAPLGLSFYMLASLSYKLDIWNGASEPERDPLHLALFTAYFPTIVSGPIERGRNLLPQLRERSRASADQIISGIHLVLFGLLKKVVIAQAAAQLVQSPIFTAPQDAGTGRVLIGLYLFALQLYADFAGYSDMARGFSRMLGIELTVNFQRPYFAGNIAEFWQRWHISLSTWLRDYVFLPFSRAMLRRARGRSALIQSAAHLLTMLVSGLWHGANWTFLAWGLLHGVYLALHRMLTYAKVLPLRWLPSWLGRAFGMLVTFHAVLLGWVLFQASSLNVAGEIFQRLATDVTARELRYLFARPLALYLLMIVLDVVQARSEDYEIILRVPLLLRALIYVLIGVALWSFWQLGAGTFIYAGF